MQGIEYGKMESGYRKITLDSWKDFFKVVDEELLDYEAYIWRGQRDEKWVLEPTLDRLIATTQVPMNEKDEFRNDHLEQFKFAARGRRGRSPSTIKEENDWWALGQHHGLSTPLLDWSKSPFVAAYFAFIGRQQRDIKYRAVYALFKPSVDRKCNQIIRDKIKGIEEEKKKIKAGEKSANALRDQYMLDMPMPTRKEVEFIKPMSDENARLVSQGGLFTRSPNDTDLKEWVQSRFSGEKEAVILMKILIPNKDRDVCLKMLNRMNINHLTLFPDLYGASKFCNLFGEIKGY